MKTLVCCIDHRGGNEPMAGLNITLIEYIAWSRRLHDRLLLNVATMQTMWTPFEFSGSDRRFLHGWDVYPVNGHESFGFSGGGLSGFRILPEQDLTIIVLTTGYQNYSLQDIIIDQLAGMTDPSLMDDQAALREEIMGRSFLATPAESPEAVYARISADSPREALEPVFSSIASTLFFELKRRGSDSTLRDHSRGPPRVSERSWQPGLYASAQRQARTRSRELCESRRDRSQQRLLVARIAQIDETLGSGQPSE